MTEIIVTLKSYNTATAKRYVVDPQDHDLFDDIVDGPVLARWERERDNNAIDLERRDSVARLDFGGQRLQSRNRVNEMYRTLSGYDVVKIRRVGNGSVTR